MPTPTITLEALPAGFGDCLLISCPVGRRTWRPQHCGALVLLGGDASPAVVAAQSGAC